MRLCKHANVVSCLGAWIDKVRPLPSVQSSGAVDVVCGSCGSQDYLTGCMSRYDHDVLVLSKPRSSTAGFGCAVWHPPACLRQAQSTRHLMTQDLTSSSRPLFQHAVRRPHLAWTWSLSNIGGRQPQAKQSSLRHALQSTNTRVKASKLRSMSQRVALQGQPVEVPLSLCAHTTVPWRPGHAELCRRMSSTWWWSSWRPTCTPPWREVPAPPTRTSAGMEGGCPELANPELLLVQGLGHMQPGLPAVCPPLVATVGVRRNADERGPLQPKQACLHAAAVR